MSCNHKEDPEDLEERRQRFYQQWMAHEDAGNTLIKPSDIKLTVETKPVFTIKDAIRMRGHGADLTVDMSRIPPEDQQLFIQVVVGYFPVGITDPNAAIPYAPRKPWWRRTLAWMIDL